MINKLLLIPDTQVKPGVDIGHLIELGHWIADERPDVIVHIGDHWDMPSLSSYDKGTAKIEGKRVKEDIESGNIAMRALLGPMRELQQRQRDGHRKVYQPEMHFHMGNHEHRINRYENSHPEVQGFMGLDRLDLSDWTVHDFLVPNVLEGVHFCHYFYNPNSGKPFGGTMEFRLNKTKRSIVFGHEQGFKYAQDACGDRIIHGLMAGSFYTHDEDYKGPQGNNHWRGYCVLHNVQDGQYDLQAVRIN